MGEDLGIQSATDLAESELLGMAHKSMCRVMI